MNEFGDFQEHRLPLDTPRRKDRHNAQPEKWLFLPQLLRCHMRGNVHVWEIFDILSAKKAESLFGRLRGNRKSCTEILY